jgi:hypothetical protein
MAAVERVAQFDPALAEEMMQSYQENMYRQAQQQSMEAARKSQIDDRTNDLKFTLSNRAARLLQGVETPEQLMYAMTIIDRFAQANNLTLDDLALTPAMTLDEARQYSRQDMTVNQQEALPRRDRALEQADRRIGQTDERIEITRSRPPQGRAPRAETDSEREIRIGNMDPADRSPGEQAWYRNRQSGNNGGRPNVRPPSRPSSSKPRIVGSRPAD